MTNLLGDKIRELRNKRKLTLDQLAIQSKVSKAYLSQLENGQSERPSADVLYKIATVLGTSIGALLGKRIATEEHLGQIPKALAQAAVEFGISETYVNRLASLSMRNGSKKDEYSKEAWKYLYDTLKRLDQNPN